MRGQQRGGMRGSWPDGVSGKLSVGSPLFT